MPRRRRALRAAEVRPVQRHERHGRRCGESQPPEGPYAIEKALESDRRFFERRPYRRYRFQRAFPSEVEQFAEVVGVELALVPSGYVGAIVAPKFGPGVRLRQPILALRTNDFDISDAEAATVIAALRAGPAFAGGPS